MENLHSIFLSVPNILLSNQRFKIDIDFIDLKTYTSAVSVLKELGFTQAQIGNANNIYILSERGYAKLIKIMDTDLAWDFYNVYLHLV